MSTYSCVRATTEELTDYWAGDLADAQAAAFEEHLFSCSECARALAAIEALARGVGHIMRDSQLGVVVTDAVLNRLARDGVRVRSFVLAPGDVVPCAVWDGDEVMALRLRGDFTGATTVSVVRRLSSGEELARNADVPLTGARNEIILATPAASLRRLPSVQMEVTVIGESSGANRTMSTYTLRHAGALNR